MRVAKAFYLNLKIEKRHETKDQKIKTTKKTWNHPARISSVARISASSQKYEIKKKNRKLNMSVAE